MNTVQFLGFPLVLPFFLIILLSGLSGCTQNNPQPALNPDLVGAVTSSEIKNVVPLGSTGQALLRGTYGAPITPSVYNSYQWNYPDDAYFQSTKVDIFPNEDNCGDYWVNVLINGQQATVYATICKLVDNTWRLMAIKAL